MRDGVRVAAVQASPVLFDRDATLDRVGELVARAAARGAELVVLPEAFVPAYPRGLGFGAIVGSRSPEGRDLWARYHDQSVEVPGPATERLGAIAADHRVWLAVGVVERERRAGRGTLYCTLLYFASDGRLVGLHRKLKPTGSERLIWGEGDGSTLAPVDTPWGPVGGLICWENYMPLARMALYAKGVRIWLAPTADCRDGWQSTLRHVALEGRCFVVGCNQFVTRSDYPDDVGTEAERAALPEEVCRGGSAIYSPLGECLAGPAWGAEEILVADLDLTEIARGKYDFDVAGHYARPDVFRLIVDERPRTVVERAEPAAPAAGADDPGAGEGSC